MSDLSKSQVPRNLHGALTLVPMPGFEAQAKRLKNLIEEKSCKEGEYPTPVDVVCPEFGKRSNGEPYVRLRKHHVGGHDCIVLGSGPGTWEMIGRLIFLLRYLAGRHAARIAVAFGYHPLSRSDKDEGDKEFALTPILLDFMMSATYDKLDRIIAADLHASQVVMSGRTGLITEISLVRRLLEKAVEDVQDDPNGHICLAFPDTSASKRVKKTVKSLNMKFDLCLPAVYGLKDRVSSVESKLEELLGEVGALEGATVFSIDDEAATFGTNIDSATILKKRYAAKRVWAMVTHGVLCGPAAERLADPDCPIDRLYTMDTIPYHNRPHLHKLIEEGKLIPISWEEDLAWIIYKHHWNMNIREVR